MRVDTVNIHTYLDLFVCFVALRPKSTAKIVSEYDQEIPQSQNADNPVAPRGRDAQPS